MLCNKCGQQFEGEAQFCPYCGSAIEPSAGQSQPLVQPQSQQVQQQPVQQQPVQQQQPAQQQYGRQPAQQQYTQQPAQQYSQQPQAYQPQNPAPQGGGGKKGVMIAGICIGVALLIVGIIIVVLLLKKDDDKAETKEKKEITTEAVTETTTAEPTTEAVTEATTAEPEPVSYAEEMGIQFSDIGTKAEGANYSTFSEYGSDNSGERLDLPGVTVTDGYFSKYIKNVTVSEPDQDGNVIYSVEILCNEKCNIQNAGKDSWSHSFNSWRPTSFDYYSGAYIMDDYYYGIDTRDNMEKSTLEFGDKTTDVYATFSYGGYNTKFDKQSTSEGEDIAVESDLKYVYKFKVPQDYDGIVMALYNTDVNPEEYDLAIETSEEERFKDSDGNTRKFLDRGFNGNPKKNEDYLFFKICDAAVAETPELNSEIYSSISNSNLAYFEWIDEVTAGDYSQGNQTITDPKNLDGWWEGYILWDPDNKMDCYAQELCNVKLSSSGSSVDWTFDYYMIKIGDDGDWTEKSDEDSTLTGTFNTDGTLSFDPAAAGMAFDMYGFYTDGYCQYAVGWITAQSGESAWVFLYRK